MIWRAREKEKHVCQLWCVSFSVVFSFQTCTRLVCMVERKKREGREETKRKRLKTGETENRCKITKKKSLKPLLLL